MLMTLSFINDRHMHKTMQSANSTLGWPGKDTDPQVYEAMQQMPDIKRNQPRHPFHNTQTPN